MNAELTNKKLLILSGGAKMRQVIEAAREMGVYTIVTDMYTDYDVTPAKKDCG